MVFYPKNPTMDKNKYTVKIALVVLALLIFAGAYIGYSTYKNSPEWKAQQMLKAQDELLKKIAEEQTQTAEEAKSLIAEMERKKKEQEKIYQAYLSGAKMDQAELNRIQDRLKNLEYCEAMMSFECFTNTASGAPVSSAPSHTYSLITTAYAHDDTDRLRNPMSHSIHSDIVAMEARKTSPWENRGAPRDDTILWSWAKALSPTRETLWGSGYKSPAWSRETQKVDMRYQLHTLQASTAGGQETPEERTERKIQWVIKLGYREDPTRAIFNACKNKAKDPQHCLVVWLTLMHNESGSGQKSVACTKRHNCLGVKSGKTSYKTYEDGMNAWVAIYNKYWYKAKWASFFYSQKWKLPPSRYCTSEHSSNSSVGCPNGLKIASAQWEKISKIIK